jgi:hypothetical protein
MADMQRAINSKRAIAEITLTRMCDTKLSESNESLLLRIEELEKAVRMMKLGVTSAPVVEKAVDESKHDSAPKKAEVKQEPSVVKSVPKGSLSVYGEWGIVLKKIAELKRSLSAGFAGASVYTDGANKFVIKMSGFFCDKLKSSDTDLAIIRGVIAENEGKNTAEIDLVIENKDNTSNNNSSDLEDMFK